jgi:hypothetical protein
MLFIRRFAYFLYYLREEDLRLMRKYLDYAFTETGKSRLSILADLIISVFRYNISFKDYFCFRFYKAGQDYRKEWAGTGFMYEYQLRMNPRKEREVLENKILFLRSFKDVISRKYLPLSNEHSDMIALSGLLDNSSGLLVLKNSLGQVGAQVEIIRCYDYTPEQLLDYMKKKEYDLIEEYVIQHPDLNALSPSGLNTVRIITQLHNNQVVVLGARLRVSVNSAVDNLAAGNLAAPVDPETGIVIGKGVFSDIRKDPVSRHPVTGKQIEGFIIPYWERVMKLIDEAARRLPGNRSVGWDIAVTPQGPELIEGNHNWCKLLWQLPVNRGLKNELLTFL